MYMVVNEYATCATLNCIYIKQDTMENKYSYDWCPAFTDFLMPETQQLSIVIILIIYSPYFLEKLV